MILTVIIREGFVNTFTNIIFLFIIFIIIILLEVASRDPLVHQRSQHPKQHCRPSPQNRKERSLFLQTEAGAARELGGNQAKGAITAKRQSCYWRETNHNFVLLLERNKS